jgi:hypothetical protein
LAADSGLGSAGFGLVRAISGMMVTTLSGFCAVSRGVRLERSIAAIPTNTRINTFSSNDKSPAINQRRASSERGGDITACTRGTEPLRGCDESATRENKGMRFGKNESILKPTNKSMMKNHDENPIFTTSSPLNDENQQRKPNFGLTETQTTCIFRP